MFERLSHLPRETRDTLFLLLVIAWVAAPKVGEVPAWCSALTVVILLWRGLLAWQGRPLPSRWVLMGLLALCMGATFFSHRTLLGRDAGVTFLLVLLALKTLEMRARRDAFAIFFLGFFTLLSNFFYSQSMGMAASMLIGLLGLLTAVVLSHMPVGRPPLLLAARQAGWMALLGAPIMAVLFMLFPRIAPLWGLPSDAVVGRSGLSSSMQVGTIAKLALDSSVALRVRFDGEMPERSQMYFRGPVLSDFDGREWRAKRAFTFSSTDTANLRTEGAPVRYEITMEPTQRPWLLVLDAAVQAPRVPALNARMTPDLQWLVNRPVTDLLRYQAESYPRFTHGPLARSPALFEYMALPQGFNPRTQALASEIRRDPQNAGADTARLVEVVLDRLRTGGYSYTLEPGLFGTHTADEFWFDRKQGFCEHIASSFVLLMRAMGVPARVVTGYQGGELNTVDGFWTVRQSDAHAWSEVWMPSRGWVRVDPTASVAPGRTGLLQRLEAPSSVFSRALVTVSPRFNINLRAYWEAVNNSWNQWVLNYSQARQLDMLRNLGFESPDWMDLSYVLLAIVVGASVAGALWTLWERHRQDPWQRMLMAARKRLRTLGLPAHDHLPPRALADLLATMPAAGTWQAHRQWLLHMEQWRYAPRQAQTAQSLATLRAEFRGLDWSAPPTTTPTSTAAPA